MLNERVLKNQLEKIKKSLSDVAEARRKQEFLQDELFTSLLYDLHQDHEKLVNMVRVCRFELTFRDLLAQYVGDGESF